MLSVVPGTERKKKCVMYVFLPSVPNYRRTEASLVAHSKESTQNAGDMGLSLGWEDPLEEMATSSSIIAWENPWTEEPGRLHTVHGITKNQT